MAVAITSVQDSVGIGGQLASFSERSVASSVSATKVC
jgi:hypothetical protein